MLIMLLLLHIVIALSSLLFSAYAYIIPSIRKLKISYALLVLTVASGTYLVVSAGVPMLRSCLTGLVYVVVTLGGILATHHKLLRSQTKPQL